MFWVQIIYEASDSMTHDARSKQSAEAATSEGEHRNELPVSQAAAMNAWVQHQVKDLCSQVARPLQALLAQHACIV